MQRELSTFLDDYRGCIVIRKDTDKVILKVPAAVSGAKALFVKIYLFSDIGRRLRNLVRGKKNGVKDYRTCKRLELLGVAVPKPVGAYADFPIPGLARRSLFAARWIDNALSVRDMLVAQFSPKQWPDKIVHPQRPAPLTTNEFSTDKALSVAKELSEFNRCLGAFVADIHGAGVFAKDLNVGNIMVHMPIKSNPTFLLIDYEGIIFKKRIPLSRCQSNLAQIAAFMSQVDPQAPRCLCRGYVEKNRQIDLSNLTACVTQQSEILQKKWLSKLNDMFEKIGRKLHHTNAN